MGYQIIGEKLDAVGGGSTSPGILRIKRICLPSPPPSPPKAPNAKLRGLGVFIPSTGTPDTQPHGVTAIPPPLPTSRNYMHTATSPAIHRVLHPETRCPTKYYTERHMRFATSFSVERSPLTVSFTCHGLGVNLQVTGTVKARRKAHTTIWNVGIVRAPLPRELEGTPMLLHWRAKCVGGGVLNRGVLRQEMCNSQIFHPNLHRLHEILPKKMIFAHLHKSTKSQHVHATRPYTQAR